MTVTEERTAKKAVGGRRPATHLEPSPYNLTKPMEPAPERQRTDPRIPHQRLTAFWVVEDKTGEHIGRVAMVEMEDQRGWFYRTEVIAPGGRRPQIFGEPTAKRAEAVDAVVDERRRLAKAHAREAESKAADPG